MLSPRPRPYAALRLLAPSPYILFIGTEVQQFGDESDPYHRAVDLPIPYRVILHMGEPGRPDDRTYVLPLWMLA